MTRQRRGNRPGEETPFVDLAFSLLGPIAAIMIILAAAYASVSRVPDCNKPTPAEATAAAAALRAWYMDAQARIPEGRKFVDQACPGGKLATAAAALPEMSPLHGICREAVDGILTAAGVTAESMNRTLNDQAALNAAVSRCEVRAPDCEEVSEAQSRVLVRATKEWWDAERAHLAESYDFLNVSCSGWSAGREPDQVPERRPDPLAALCRTDAARIMRQAGIDDAGLQAFFRQQSQAMQALTRCIPSQEMITISDEQLRFDQCKADVNKGPDFFVDEGKKIYAKVLEKKYNRIDIFGHSDSRVIKTACQVRVHRDGYPDSDYVVRDNVMLSLLRADAFLNALLAAIRVQPDLQDLKALVDAHSLRFHAIGVGDAEPKETDDESRRIEIRFVKDNQLK